MKLEAFRIIKSDERLENWMFIELISDSGLHGFGEISSAPYNADPVAKLAWKYLNSLIGRNLELDLIPEWDCDFTEETSIIRSTVISGIDQALLDLMTKRIGVPLYKHLGGTETSIPLYANINRALRKNRDNNILLEHIQQARNCGFTSIKIAPFDALSPDSSAEEFNTEVRLAISRIEKALQIMGTGNVSIDCHQRLNKKTAEFFIDVIKQDCLPLEYIEDVLSYTPENNEFINYLNDKYDYIFAGGETCISKAEVCAIAQDKCFRIMNPDIKFIGHISDYIDAYRLIKDRGISMRPHNPTSPIATAFSAAIISCMNDDTELEFAFGNQTVRDMLIGEKEQIRDGIYKLSDSPGIGIGISDDFIRDHCCIFTGDSWYMTNEYINPKLA